MWTGKAIQSVRQCAEFREGSVADKPPYGSMFNLVTKCTVRPYGSFTGPLRVPYGSLMGPLRVPHGSLTGPFRVRSRAHSRGHSPAHSPAPSLTPPFQALFGRPVHPLSLFNKTVSGLSRWPYFEPLSCPQLPRTPKASGPVKIYGFFRFGFS